MCGEIMIMTVDELRARVREITDELRAIDAEAGERCLSASQQRRFDALLKERDERTDELREIADRTAQRARIEAGAGLRVESGDGAACGPVRQVRTAAGVRDEARRLVEELHRTGRLPAHGAERVDGMVTNPNEPLMSRYALALGSEHYRTAFAKLVSDPVRGHMLFTDEEQRAWHAVQRVDQEMRALTTASITGVLVPLTIDPAVILTNAGTINPIRALARNVTTLTASWSGVTSAGATSHWYAEAAQVSDDAPSVAQPTIATHRSATWIPVSAEAGDDGGDTLLNDVMVFMTDSLERLHATAFVTGAGDASNEPYGIVTELAGGSSEVAPVTAETLDAATVRKVFDAIPARHKAVCQWVMNGAIIGDLEALETTSGALRFPSLQDTPPTLLRKPVHECSDMDGSYNIAATANNYLILLGDWENYVIVTRLGSRVELVPHLFGANQRPTGERGFFQISRVGAECVNDGAFRMLNLATTA
jgi:HK97 family phage major capsid protein